MARTLKGIARGLGADGFKRYAKDYGNERVNLDGSVDDAIYILEAYQDDKDLIDHYNAISSDVYDEYYSKDGSRYIPFYKTPAFNEQCNELRAQGLFATDFV